MDSRNASHSGFDTLADIVYPGTTTPSIWCSSRDMGLSDVGGIDARNLSPSTASQTIRDRQILEQLLTIANIPTAKAMAAELVQEHGSLAAALTASAEQVIADPISTLLSSVQSAVVESLRPKTVDRMCLTKARDVIEYLVVAMAHLPVEEVRVLFLDAKNRLIRDEAIARGSVSEAPIYPREILRRSLVLGATALILAHNHPSGDPEPSDSDILATHRLAKAGTELGIAVHDHIIIGRMGWVSLRDRGQI